MAAGGLDVEPDVVVIGVEQVPHRDVADHDLAVGRGRPGRREGAAMRLLGPDGPLFGRLAESPAFQTRRRGLEGIFEEVGFDVGIDRDHVEEIDRPAVVPGPGRGGSVGDPLHFLDVFRVEPAQKQSVGDQPQVVPGVGRCLAAAVSRQLADEAGDFGRHQAAVLEAALVRGSFDVQDDPARLRISIARAEPLDRRGIDSKSLRRSQLGSEPAARTERGAAAMATIAAKTAWLGLVMIVLCRARIGRSGVGTRCRLLNTIIIRTLLRREGSGWARCKPE